MSRSAPSRRPLAQIAAFWFAVATVVASAQLRVAHAQDEGLMAGGLQLRAVRSVHVDSGVDVVVAGQARRLFDFHLIENRPLGGSRMPEPRSGDDRLENRIRIEPVLFVDDARARVVARDDERGAFAWLVPARIDLSDALFWWTYQPAGTIETWEKKFWARHRSASRPELAALARPPFSHGPPGVTAPTFSRSELRAVAQPGRRYTDLAGVVAESQQRLANPPPSRRLLVR